MRVVAGALVAVLTLGLALPRAVEAEVTAEQVNRAISEAIGFLQRQQRPDGSWDDHLTITGGTTSLCTLALLTAGVPVDDPGMQKALNYLRKLEPRWNYVIALQTMVFAMAEPQKDVQLLIRNVKILESRQLRDRTAGGWSYDERRATSDNSNAQFVLLALHEAERAGVSTSEVTWRLAREYWEQSQNADGSWGYKDGLSGTGSMTCAGISALLMAREKLDAGDAQVDGDSVECCGDQSDDTAIARAMGWMSRNFSVHQNPGDGGGHILYYLYGLERVGRLINRRLIGRHDWYREGADALLRRQVQLGGGAWVGVGNGETNQLVGTSFALLFLSKGRRPVLAAKLSFAPGESWDNHRQDLAHLTRYCEQKWERELTWQVIRSQEATADDLNQAPVLFISGSERPKFTAEELRNMRRYLDTGGFIFAENCCGGKEFDAGFREALAQMFPERDERGTLLHQLRPLPLQHPVWNAEEPVDPKFMRPLEGLDVGCRTSVIYCPDNLGCYWELDRVGRNPYPIPVEEQLTAVRSIGINVMAYATNREIKYKLDIPPLLAEADKPDAVQRAKLFIAELKHGGESNIAPTALINLLKQLSVDSGLRVSVEKRELALTQDALFDQHMVFMHGRSGFTLTDEERKQLRLFVERGGLVFADAVCSSEAFAVAFRKEMAATFPDAPLKAVPGDAAMFTERFGGFDLAQVSLRDPRRAGADGPLRADVIHTAPELEGLQLGDRYGVIFSKYDLSCALERHNSLECPGYDRDDAAKIGINVILFSLRGNL
ncbi:MAG: DUF4159 domain-containing protein [Planctomycetaceae bacterium]|nr:DUF4159 domain-containing protein [Planctomycetaceae bacterium]